ncbi:sulfide/dihydroorotate dehydrogenase-like FAD/NAD-binding protein [Lutibacter sp. B2]|nr:sulfide/dihydroorotate dehydrogenase-like FAD/NAD-binding protein [Lutibacter sp. B2]
MVDKRLQCIDAGSEYCPCYLAECNECIICSHLQGKSACECDWSGVCIYQEFFWCGNKKRNTREECNAKIVQKKMIKEDLAILKIKVNRTLARQLKHPGSYVFVREVDKPTFFDAPMSIMNVDEDKSEIDIALRVVGSKTKSLIEVSEDILLRGPYWNGLIGLKQLKNTSNEEVMVVARGLGMAPAALTLKYLLKNNNKVTFIIDPGKVDIVFIKDYIKEYDVDINILNLKQENDMEKFRNIIKNKNFSLAYSAGSDNFHRVVYKEVKKNNMKTKFVITNNNTICCGEGICGSCICKTANGDEVKMCKTQIQSGQILGKEDVK